MELPLQTKVSMMVVDVYDRSNTSTNSPQKFMYSVYVLDTAGLPSRTIKCSIADPLMKQWKKQKYGYGQRKVMLWSEAK